MEMGPQAVRAKNGQTVRLTHLCVGSRLYTTREWLDQFFHEMTAADLAGFDAEADRADRFEPARPKPRTRTQRERDIEAAESELGAVGI